MAGSIHATQSVFAGDNEYFSAEDLRQFQELYGLVAQTLHVKQGHSALSCTGAFNCGESNLDVQYMTAVSQSTNTTYWYVYNTTSSSMDIFLSYLIELLEETAPPLVNSISYGTNEQVL